MSDVSEDTTTAFHHACDQGDFEVAEQLLSVLEMMITALRLLRPDTDRRRDKGALVAAHERLWHL